MGVGGLGSGTRLPACKDRCTTKTSLCTYLRNSLAVGSNRAILIRAKVTVRLPLNAMNLVCTEDKLTDGGSLTPTGGINIISYSCQNRIVITLRGRNLISEAVRRNREVTRVMVTPCCITRCARTRRLSRAIHNRNNFNSAKDG